MPVIWQAIWFVPWLAPVTESAIWLTPVILASDLVRALARASNLTLDSASTRVLARLVI